MKKLVLLLLLFLPLASAASIADYPHIFVKNGKFKPIYVVGDDAPSLDVVAATVLSTALAKYPNITTEVGTSTLDSEITDITDENAIVIGSPCEMSTAAMLQGNPKPCYKHLAASTGHIRLYEHNNKYQLLITGLTEEDRHEAALFLANQPLKDIRSRTHAIRTMTNSTPQYYNRTTKKNTKVIYTPSTQNISESQPETGSKVTEQESETQEKEISKKSKEPEYGEYEPLERIPEKRGFLARLWAWLKGLFT